MKQVVKWTAEGAAKCDYHKVFCDVAGRRHLPGICWYPAKRTAYAVNQGGTADRKVFVLDRSLDSVRGFFAAQTLLRQDRGSVFCLSEVPYEVFTKPGNHQSLCGKRRI